MTPLNTLLPITATIAPANEAEVADVLRDAGRDGLAVYPIGGGTCLDYGPLPTRSGLGLSLKNLDQLIDYPVDDLTITVEAGMTFAALSEHLAANRQRLPLDVPQPEKATVGGLLATDFSGARRYAHGTIRDFVIGLRAVDGRGAAFASGGRVVKNAAGYDLCRMLIGSMGTLGVVTQVTLKVKPMPETTAMVACDVADMETAEKLLAELVNTKTLPSAIEMLVGPAWEDNEYVGSLSESKIAKLIVGFEGSPVEVDWMVGQLLEEWRQQGVGDAQKIESEQAESLWDWLTEFPAQLQVGTRPSETVAMAERLLDWEPDCSMQVHAGDGTIRVCHWPLLPNRAASVLNGRLRPMIEEAGGRMTVLCCPGNTELTAEDIWGRVDERAAVARGIKDRFDPKAVLNPDRFIF